jgi:hypothetical protein
MNLWDYVRLNRDKLMNVSDLISELSKLDGTLPVLIQIDDVGATPIKTVDAKFKEGIAVILSSD